MKIKTPEPKLTVAERPRAVSEGFVERTNRPASNNMLLYSTILVGIVIFVALIGLVILLSGSFSTGFANTCVAVVTIDQPITVESSDPSLFSGGSPGSEEIAKSISDLNKRDDVGAVLFVMNSPGGSVVATREIYDSVKELKKPKVAYFREVSASGSYYVSTATDYIISDPDAITGSIGVIATFTDMSGLLGKVGINATSVQSGIHKDIGSSNRPMTENETKILQVLISEVFEEFKGVVVTNRGSKLNMEKFNEILDGRIVSGRQAKVIGLVDALGTKKDALKKAAELGEIATEDGLPRTCDIELGGPQNNGLFGLDGIFGKLSLSKKFQLSYQ
ncbi:MAG: signal peptide peptidase SppA [Candidatus Micrarchaeota archaeon]|nr:signal peptide peptidase SppA [Candidatus Micrarchaeota archaeon]